MSFLDIRFPVDISYGASGGPGWSTDVVTVNSGFEARNQNWQDSRYAFDVSFGVRTQAQLDELITFFRISKGRAHSFRFRDQSDYEVTATQGVFASIDATHYQMQKRYLNGAMQDLRDITLPVAGTVSVTGGAGVTIDYATGIVTVTSGTPTAWSGEYDIPCRFDVDRMKVVLDAHGTYSWGAIPIVEVRI